jgi:hypothetical protein
MIRLLAIALVLGLAPTLAAQDAIGPVWIVRDETPAPARVSPARPVGRSLMSLGLVVAVGSLAAWRRRPTEPAEAAFERLGARFGLDASDRALLRSIGARERVTAPVALLLSESALRRVLERTRRATRDPGERAHLHRIEAMLLG